MSPVDQSPLPPFVLANPGPLRDRLVAAVLSGAKTATSSLLDEYIDEPLPRAGERFGVIDSSERQVAVVEIISVEVIALRDAALDLAVAEGEGFTTVEAWRAAHEEFWRGDEAVAALGIQINDDTPIVVEYFRVVPDSGPD